MKRVVSFLTLLVFCSYATSQTHIRLHKRKTMDLMRKVLFISCLMTAIAASAQENVVDSVEEWIPDSIEVDSIAMDEESCQDLDISDCELTNRYGVIIQGGKYGIRDYEKKENVTEIIYDYASPAFRRKVEDEYITYFSVSSNGHNGIVGIIESSNKIMTIMAPPQEEE